MSKIVTFTHSGDFKKTIKFLESIRKKLMFYKLNQYGEKGVSILSANTPVRTGETAASWSYEIVDKGDIISIEWHNSHMGNDGKTPVVMLIQLGHGTRTGGYVPPNDFINPTIKPLFDEIAESVWKDVVS